MRYVRFIPIFFLFATACTEAIPEGSFFGEDTAGIAVIDSSPSPLNNLDSPFNLGVGGDDVVAYRFAYDGTDTIDCSLIANYGGEFLETVDFLVAPGADGDYKVCVIAKNSEGNWQDEANATEWAWNKETVDPTVTVNQAGAQSDPTNVPSILFKVQFSENVDVNSLVAAHFSVSGGAGATVLSIVPTDAANVDVIVSAPGDGDAILSLSASSVSDSHGNVNVGSSSTDNLVNYDGTAPNVTIASPGDMSYNNTGSHVVFGTCEDGTVVNLTGDFSESPATPACSGGTFSQTVTFVGQGMMNIDADQTDLANNNDGDNLDVIVDTFAPSIDMVDSGTSDATYTDAAGINIRVNFSEDVFFDGATASLILETGANDATAVFDPGSSNAAMEFNFTVSGIFQHASNDLEYLPAGALIEVGGTFRDAAGNAADMTLPIIAGGNSLSDKADLKIVGAPANISFVPSTPYTYTGVMEGDTGSQSHTIRNDGGFVANLTGLNPPSAPYLVNGNTCGPTLAPSNDCVITIDFSPLDTSSHPDSAVVIYNDGMAPGQLATLGLEGTGDPNPLPKIQAALCYSNAFEGELYSCLPEAVGIGDAGDGLPAWRLDASSCPWLSINGLTGVISGTPGVGDGGPCSFRAVVDDGYHGDSNLWKVSLDVNGTTGIGSMGLGFQHSCVIKDGEVQCWGGGNSSGSLGRGAFGSPFEDEFAEPVVLGDGVTAALGASMVRSGDDFSCARFGGGNLKCWGANSTGQVGDGGSTDHDRTYNVGLGGVVDIALGKTHGCTLLNPDGRVHCWGRNGADALLGRGSAGGTSLTPGSVKISGGGNLMGAIDISSRDDHTCAVMKDRRILCWGNNMFGSLGREVNSSYGAYAEPAINFGTNVGGGEFPAIRISTGDDHSCATTQNGQLKCWGSGGGGRLGYENTGTFGDDAGEMANLADVNLGTGRFAVSVQSGMGHNCAALDNGNLKCWGRNPDGQVGNEDTNHVGDGALEMGDFLAPVALPGGVFKDFRVGVNHSCAKVNDGSDQLFCWGKNSSSQAGVDSGFDFAIGDGAGEMGSSLFPVVFGGGGPIGHHIFVSSIFFNGNMGGIAGADSSCQGMAAAEGLANPASYIALLGQWSPTIAPNSLMSPAFGPILNMNNETVASTFDDLFLFNGANIIEWIRYMEDGIPVADSTVVWTGANDNGSANNFDCAGWTDGSSGPTGRTGVAAEPSPATLSQSFSNGSGLFCNNSRQIYCIATIPGSN